MRPLKERSLTMQKNFELRKDSNHITLGQLLKSEAHIHSGGMCKEFLEENQVKVNDMVELRRGRKLFPGDQIHFFDTTITIIGN